LSLASSVPVTTASDSSRCFIVDLHPHTAVGETQVGLRLAGAHGSPQVSDIASEGEQRALSLSFFFAEVATHPKTMAGSWSTTRCRR
jgi:hypothetical protein